MLDSVAVGVANVFPWMGAGLAAAAILCATWAIHALVSRNDRRGDRVTVAAPRYAGPRTIQAPMDTSAPPTFTRVGGSALWPSTLVGPLTVPKTASSPTRLRKAQRGQRRRLSTHGASVLHHRAHREGGQR